LELEDFGGSGPYRGTNNSQATIALSEPLEIGGQRGARKAAGRAGLAAATARSVQARAEFGYDLAMAYAGAEVAQGRVALLTQDAERAQEDLRSARALVAAGKEGELRAVQAEAAAAASSAELEGARAGVIEALGRLSTLAGSKEPYSAVGGSLLNAAGTESTGAGSPSDATMPRIATAEAEREWADRRLNVERRRAIPTPSLSIGTRRLKGDDANALVAGFSLPLPLFDRSRGDIAAARAVLSGAEARLEGARLEAQAEARTASAQFEASAARLTAANQGAVAAREAYRLARIGYEAGRTPLFELLGTRRALTEADLRLLDARLDRVRAHASLARLAGRIPFTE
jgi:cobalt-zinc-cadmium efflux system outer membrane protein